MTDHANELRRYSRKIGHPAGDVPSVMLAAAEEIERLAARLEAAEKSDAESIAMYRNARDERDALRAENETLAANLRGKHSTAGATYAHLIAERDALHAKIEAMEKQEPVATVIKEGDSRYWMSERLWTFPDGKYPLYVLPGAQPALSVPTALLVAVANLVAQMEIVSRVGFVDTPNDKDSCAAFCVAEGTWLELMSAVESLASALAAAPEIKP